MIDMLGLVEGTDCSVCLSEFQEDESVRLLPKCGHAFHIQCIDTWLRSHSNCPLCRANVICVGPQDAATVDVTLPRAGDDMSAVEDGPLFRATMKALESGEPGEFMGLRFIRTELLPKAGNNRSVIMFPPSGVLLSEGAGSEFGLMARITEMPGKRYSTQVYAAGFYGASRMDEKKVVEILCDETKL